MCECVDVMAVRSVCGRVGVDELSDEKGEEYFCTGHVMDEERDGALLGTRDVSLPIQRGRGY